LLRGKRLQVILMVRKHPKDLLLFIWDAVPNEVRGASLSLGMTKKGARQDKEEEKRSEGCLANARQDRWDGKGLLRGESLSGHPEGAQAPEGSPATGWDAILSEVRCLTWRFFASFKMRKGGRMRRKPRGSLSRRVRRACVLPTPGSPRITEIRLP
jgi:hypothetical protein